MSSDERRSRASRPDPHPDGKVDPTVRVQRPDRPAAARAGSGALEAALAKGMRLAQVRAALDLPGLDDATRKALGALRDSLLGP